MGSLGNFFFGDYLKWKVEDMVVIWFIFLIRLFIFMVIMVWGLVGDRRERLFKWVCCRN